MTISLSLAFGKTLNHFIGVSPTGALDKDVEDVDKVGKRVQPIARIILASFKMTLDDSRSEVLVPRLDTIPLELRGFAYEGAGLGLMLLDCLLPWKDRFNAFTNGPGTPYINALYIGAGLALAKLHRQPERCFARLDPFFCWSVTDGYGFYKGYFSWKRTIEEKVVPTHLSDYARCIFDHGVGRSIWFATDGNVARIATTIAHFPQARQTDLWTGVGFACAYAGGVLDRTLLEALRTAAGSYRSQLALGGVLASKSRQRVGNQALHTDLACEVFCGLSSDRAAYIADHARQNLPANNSAEPAYKIWRQRIAAELALQTTKEKTINPKHSLP